MPEHSIFPQYGTVTICGRGLHKYVKRITATKTPGHAKFWYKCIKCGSTKNYNHRPYITKRFKELWNMVLNHYTRYCSCCGETNELFLTISHLKKLDKIEQNGHDRYGVRRLATYSQLLYIIKQNYPKNKYCIECWNCNCGRRRNKGICPHKSSKFNKSHLIML